MKVPTSADKTCKSLFSTHFWSVSQLLTEGMCRFLKFRLRPWFVPAMQSLHEHLLDFSPAVLIFFLLGLLTTEGFP